MPEMPDVTVYAERLARRVLGQRLERIRVLNPFLVRTAVPPLATAEGRRVEGVERLAKRIVVALEGELFLVIHLMIAGRLKWLAPGAKLPGRIALALFEFETAGTLLLSEAGTQRRASLHLVQGRAALAAMDPGGIDVMSADLAAFAARLAAENHTVSAR
jgi:formamidopyrimidine-DNA glycosylase